MSVEYEDLTNEEMLKVALDPTTTLEALGRIRQAIRSRMSPEASSLADEVVQQFSLIVEGFYKALKEVRRLSIENAQLKREIGRLD